MLFLENGLAVCLLRADDTKSVSMFLVNKESPLRPALPSFLKNIFLFCLHVFSCVAFCVSSPDVACSDGFVSAANFRVEERFAEFEHRDSISPEEKLPVPSNVEGAFVPEPLFKEVSAVANGVPGIRRDLNCCRRRYGANLNRVPFFVGDGCGPGASSSQMIISRYAWVNEGMNLIGTELQAVNNSVLFNLEPKTVEAIPPVITGPGLGNVTNTPPILIGASGASGAGGTLSFTTAGQQVTQNRYQAAAAAQFATDNPGTNGTTQFASAASGFIQSPADISSFAYYDYLVDTTMLTPGYNVGFVKLTENVSPLPRDRVYMNYSYFHNAFFSPQYRQDVNRFMPGFEKTFWDGWTSVEIRTPFAATLDATQTQSSTSGSGLTNADSVEFGNLSVIFKSVIQYGESWALTGGAQVMCPTASDVSILNSAGQTQLFVENQSTHVMPFLGFIWAPNNRFFSQSILQVDVDANGNPVWANASQSSDIFAPANYAGRLNYPTFLYASFGGGYWIYQDNSRSARLTGIAPLMEVHVNQALSETDCIRFNNYVLGNNLGTPSLVNGLLGINFEWGLKSTLTVAYATPLGGGADRWFDGELRAFYNWRFGPQTRLTRVQF